MSEKETIVHLLRIYLEIADLGGLWNKIIQIIPASIFTGFNSNRMKY